MLGYQSVGAVPLIPLESLPYQYLLLIMMELLFSLKHEVNQP